MMDDYISRKGAIEALCAMECGDDSEHCVKRTCEVFTTLMRLPAAPVREVKRGRWIIKNGVQYAPEAEQGCVKVIKVQCSSCRWRMYLTDSLEQAWNYCPNCGADMREESE